jgi:Zn finger protein HypA/HybF involved in hydrogenase expression
VAIGPAKLALAVLLLFLSLGIGVGLVALAIARRRRAAAERRCPDCELPLAPEAIDCPHCGRPGSSASDSPVGDVVRAAHLLRPIHLLVMVPALLFVAFLTPYSDPISFALAALVLLLAYAIPVAMLEAAAWWIARSRKPQLRACPACGRPLSLQALRCPRCDATRLAAGVHG